MFSVVQKWSNWDSEKKRIVAVFPTRLAAEEEVKARTNNRAHPWSAYIIEEVV